MIKKYGALKLIQTLLLRLECGGGESNEGNDRSEPKDDTINNDTTINDNTTNSDTITIRVKDQSSKAAKMTTVLDAYALRKRVLVSEVCVVYASVSCGMLKE